MAKRPSIDAIKKELKLFLVESFTKGQTLHIGIDPGITGAMAVFAPHLKTKCAMVIDLPVYTEVRKASKAMREARKNAKVKKKKVSQTERSVYLFEEIADILRVIKKHASDYELTVLATYEQSKVMVSRPGAKPCFTCKRPFGQTIYSAASTGFSNGIWPLIFYYLKMNPRAAEPGKWKKDLGLTKKKKDASIALVLKKWPSLKAQFNLKKHHNRAEALLIAYHRSGGLVITRR